MINMNDERPAWAQTDWLATALAKLTPEERKLLWAEADEHEQFAEHIIEVLSGMGTEEP